MEITATSHVHCLYCHTLSLSLLIKKKKARYTSVNSTRNKREVKIAHCSGLSVQNLRNSLHVDQNKLGSDLNVKNLGF